MKISWESRQYILPCVQRQKEKHELSSLTHSFVLTVEFARQPPSEKKKKKKILISAEISFGQ